MRAKIKDIKQEKTTNNNKTTEINRLKNVKEEKS